MPSTVIASLSYDAPSATLRVVYTSGVTYDYAQVPVHVYESLKASRTKGVYLNQHIKGKYHYKKVTVQ